MIRTKSTYLAVLAFLLSPMVANAVPIVISGTPSSDGTWEVTMFEGVFSEHQTLLESQEWWGDMFLTELFAATLQDMLGFPNFGARGPGFAGTSDSAFVGINPNGPVQGFWWRPDDPPRTQGFIKMLDVTQVWATAVRVPEPGTLALIGLGLFGMGLARRRKKV